MEQSKVLSEDATILNWNEDGSHSGKRTIYQLRRRSDGIVFTVGDRVTNGTKMVGYIKAFHTEGGETYVSHTWSGVDMSLNSIVKVDKLPCDHQQGDRVTIEQKAMNIPCAIVKKVHFDQVGHVSYDLEIQMQAGVWTRIYNIDGDFVDHYKQVME